MRFTFVEGMFVMLDQAAVCVDVSTRIETPLDELTFEELDQLGRRITEWIARADELHDRVMVDLLIAAKSQCQQAQRAPMSDIPKSLRFRILKRDAFKCCYCGKSAEAGAILHVDHIITRCSGGTNDPDNLTTACADCNHGKGPHPGNGRRSGAQDIATLKTSRRLPRSKEIAVETGFVGQFFHSRLDGKIKWQGHVVSQIGPDRYLVQLASWLDGYPTERKIVSFDDMAGWSFYRTAHQMRWAAAQEFHWSIDDFEAGERCIDRMNREALL